MARFTDSVGRSSCPASPGVLEAGALNAQQSTVDGLHRAYPPIFVVGVLTAGAFGVAKLAPGLPQGLWFPTSAPRSSAPARAGNA
jgi:hypothetical protein